MLLGIPNIQPKPALLPAQISNKCALDLAAKITPINLEGHEQGIKIHFEGICWRIALVVVMGQTLGSGPGIQMFVCRRRAQVFPEKEPFSPSWKAPYDSNKLDLTAHGSSLPFKK
nr:uncharacterized protein LOC115269214 [Aedes albopictus]